MLLVASPIKLLAAKTNYYYTDEKRNMIIKFQRIIEYLENLPITVLSVDNVEADDVIAYIGKQVYNKP